MKLIRFSENSLSSRFVKWIASLFVRFLKSGHPVVYKIKFIGFTIFTLGLMPLSMTIFLLDLGLIGNILGGYLFIMFYVLLPIILERHTTSFKQNNNNTTFPDDPTNMLPLGEDELVRQFEMLEVERELKKLKAKAGLLLKRIMHSLRITPQPYPL